MRLLHAKTLRLLEFPYDDNLPEYAVLSHTWGASGDEVTLKDLHSWTPWFKRKPGWTKIKGCCRQALTDGIEYVWIDTCCLDRPKSTQAQGQSTVTAAVYHHEVQLMWRYYAGARVCYVHLADVHDSPKTNPESPDSSFRRSRWFTRGWTVPEMLAPLFVRFYDASWKYVGSKAELSKTIEEVTGIGAAVVRSPAEVGRQSVACRMSWVAARETSREEDIAYCLLGLFDVASMPLDYGEGRRSAFLRLQHEILRTSKDQSLFAWGYGLPLAGTHDDCKVGMLAETPAAFRHCGEVEPVVMSSGGGGDGSNSSSVVVEPAFEITATGLQFQLPMHIDEATGTALLNLECRVAIPGASGEDDYYLVLPLDRSPNGRGEFERRPYSKPMLVPLAKLALFPVRAVNTQLTNRPHSMSKHIELSIESPRELAFELTEVYPPSALQDMRFPTSTDPPSKPKNAEYNSHDAARFTLYLSDLPWTMLSVQSALGHRFLISLERGSGGGGGVGGNNSSSSLSISSAPAISSPSKMRRTVSTQIAAVPVSRSLSGPLSAAAFSLLHLLPMFDTTPVVCWADCVDLEGMLIRSESQTPSSGNELRRVKIVVGTPGTPGSRPLSSLSAPFKKAGKKKGRKEKVKKLLI
ncbi:hypothetical protein SLS62_010608 [Diatrype stigma]|uniref:Heterokaryon incompatibility domain-containing protein n=1 Tax=Diatrype stigma TaxID=117547 RepID=A0AAN9UFZ3_9PEZI